MQIIKLPNALQQSATAQRLEGQVTSQNTANNTVNIQTESGNVEVKLSGGRQPEVGQKVQIEIPANTREGQQPRNATIRNDVALQSQTQVQNNPSLATRVTNQAPPAQTQSTTNTASTPQQSQVQTRQVTTTQPLPPVLQENVSARNTAITQAPTRALTPNDIVRLIAVPPNQANAIAQSFTASIPAPTQNTLGQNITQPNLTAQDIFFQTTSLKPALQIITPTAPQNTSLPNFQTTPTSTQNILLNQTFFTPTSTSQSFVTVPAPTPVATPTLAPTSTLTPQQTFLPLASTLNIAQPLQTTQTLPVMAAQNILNPQSTSTLPAQQAAQQVIQSATLIPAPVTFNPANPVQNNTPRLAQIDIQIIQITPPSATLQTPTINNAPTQNIPATTQFSPPLIGANTPPTLSAQVTGFTAEGLPLVTVQGLNGRLPQSYILQQAAPNLQLGSQLQIIPQNGVPLAAQSAATLNAQTLNNPLLRGFQWPALEQLMTTLQQLSPQAASALTRALPNAAQPSQLAANAMIFIAAVKSGNFDMLLGDKKIDMLQQVGKRNILSALTQDTARAGAPDAAVQSDWRAVPLPMFWDNEIHHITLFTRSEQQEQNEDEGHGKTRFIFDLSLTRMGDVQIDGLINNKRLDLIIRTQNAFSEPMQQTMRQAYSGALSQTELSGEITFQGSMHNRVHVLEKQAQLGVSI